MVCRTGSLHTGTLDGPYNKLFVLEFCFFEGGCRELRDCEAFAQPGCRFCTSSCECQQGHEEDRHSIIARKVGFMPKIRVKCVAPQVAGHGRRGTSMSTERMQQNNITKEN